MPRNAGLWLANVLAEVETVYAVTLGGVEYRIPDDDVTEQSGVAHLVPGSTIRLTDGTSATIADGATILRLSTSNRYVNPFSGADFGDVAVALTGFKIFAATVGEMAGVAYPWTTTTAMVLSGGVLVPSGAPVQTAGTFSIGANGVVAAIPYAPDPSGWANFVQMLEDLTTLNGAALDASGHSTNGIAPVAVLMEAPVMATGTLGDGTQLTTQTEGFNPSFIGLIGYVRYVLQYAIDQNLITPAYAKVIGLQTIAIDEPLNTIPQIHSSDWTVTQVAGEVVAELVRAKATLGSLDPGLRFGDIEPFGSPQGQGSYTSVAQVDAWITEYRRAAAAAAAGLAAAVGSASASLAVRAANAAAATANAEYTDEGAATLVAATAAAGAAFAAGADSSTVAAAATAAAIAIASGQTAAQAAAAGQAVLSAAQSAGAAAAAAVDESAFLGVGGGEAVFAAADIAAATADPQLLALDASNLAAATDLAYFQADVVWGVPGWITTIEALSALLASRGIPLDIIIDGYNNEATAAQWSYDALGALISVYLDPAIQYSSVNVESWFLAAPVGLLDPADSDVGAGTLANTARFVTLLNPVAAVLLASDATGGVDFYDLDFAIARVAGNFYADVLSVQLADLAADLAVTAPEHALLAGQFAATAADPLRTAAASFVPAGMGLSARNWFLVPGSGAGQADLRSLADANAIGSLYLYGGATLETAREVMLPDGIVSVVDVLPSAAGGLGFATLDGGRVADFVYLAQGDITYRVGNPWETVVDATGLGNTTIRTTAANATSNVIGANGTTARVEVTTGGSFGVGAASAHATYTLDAPSYITLAPDPSLSVIVPVANTGANAISVTAAGQSVTVLNNQFSVVYTTAAAVGGGTVFHNNGGGYGQLNLYDGGTVSLGAGITGLKAICLYASQGGPVFNLTLSAAQDGVTVYDVGGGSTITLADATQSVVNQGSVVSHVMVAAAAAGAVINGGTAGATLEITGTGTAALAAGDSNLAVTLDAAASLTLNAAASISVVVPTGAVGGGVVTLGNAAQSVTNRANSPVRVKATAAIAAGAVIDGGVAGAILELTTGGGFSLPAADRNVTLQLDAATTVAAFGPQATIIDASGTGNSSISTTAANATSNVIGANGTTARVEVTTAGSFSVGAASAHATYTLDAPSYITLAPDPSLSVIVPVANTGANAISVTAAGQSVTVLNNQFSVVYTTAAAVGGSTVYHNNGGGYGQLNLYDGGTVSLGAGITGLKAIYLYTDQGGPVFNLTLSAAQDGVTVYDVGGGSTITLADATQRVVNQGGAVTHVEATAAAAGAVVKGGTAGLVLDITGGGNATLAAADQGLSVRLLSPANLTLNALNFLLVDASVGASTITTGGHTTLLMAGTGDQIFDPGGGGFILRGTLAELSQDVINGFGRLDSIYAADLPFAEAELSETLVQGGVGLTMGSGNQHVSLLLAGLTDLSVLHTASDGAGGTYITYGP